MLKSTQRLRREVGEHRCSGSAPATRIRHPLDPLRLPSAATLPPRMLQQGANKNLSRMALALYDAGWITEDDKGDSTTLVKAGLNRLVTRTIETPHQVSTINLHVAFSLEGMFGCGGEVETDSDFWLGVSLNNDSSEIFVSEALLSLESKVKGLGEMVMQAIDSAGHRTFLAWTPSAARDVAEYVLWFGQSTQENWLEEAKANMYEEEDLEDQLSPDQYDAGFPVTWAVKPKKKLSPRKLRKLFRKHPDQSVRNAAKAILDIQNLEKENVCLPGTQLSDADPVYRGAFVRWDENDPIEQVMDDHIHDANQSSDSFTELSSTWTIPATESDCAQWIKELHLGLKLYHKLDVLLDSLTTPNQRGEENDPS